MNNTLIMQVLLWGRCSFLIIDAHSIWLDVHCVEFDNNWYNHQEAHIISDNGPVFTSSYFKTCAKEWYMTSNLTILSSRAIIKLPSWSSDLLAWDNKRSRKAWEQLSWFILGYKTSLRLLPAKPDQPNYDRAIAWDLTWICYDLILERK